MSDHFDLLVIGAGPAGEKGAAQAAYFGKRVCLVERAPRPGGAAVNSGAIPANTVRETALAFAALRQRGLYGVEVRVKPDIALDDFMHREREVVETEWVQIDENLARHDITVVQGTAHFVDAHTVEITRFRAEPRRISADIILVAAGCRPMRPEGIPFDDAIVVDSDSILTLERIPPRLIIVGGGAIGCAFASIFGALGVHVTILDPRQRLLTNFDSELSDALAAELTRRFGVQVVHSAEVESVRVDPETRHAHVAVIDGPTYVGECVLVATGRVGNSDGLGLEALGIRVDAHGFIGVDERFATAVPTIFAAGDIIGTPALASTAIEQARVAMCRAFDLKFRADVHRVRPIGIWSIPEVAMVGETEDSARAKDIPFEIGKASFRLNPRGQIVGDVHGFVKLIFRRDDRSVIGAAICGEGACELIHVASAVLAFGGTLDYFIEAVFTWPSLGDAFKYAAYDGLQRLARRLSRQAGLPAIPG